jgi:predicted enzyme related to lactoylglutathione lyase
MTKGMNTIIFPVKDLAKAKAVYTELLGVEPVNDESYYVGYKVGNQDIGLDPNGHRQGMTGPIGYFEVTDIKASVQALTAAGAETVQDVRDVGGGKLIASLKDADGNVFGLTQDS